MAAKLKKEMTEGRHAAGVYIPYRYRQGRATTCQRQPNQQGSAVMIAGFTSDQRSEGILVSDG